MYLNVLQPCRSSHYVYVVSFSNIEGGLARIENGIGAAVLENLPDQIKRSGNLAGQAAADRWTEQLKGAAKVDRFSFHGLQRSDGEPVKDVNDLLRISPESYRSNSKAIDNVIRF